MSETLEELKAFLLKVGINGEEWLLISQVFVIVFVTMLLNAAARRLLVQLAKKLENTNTHWDDMVVFAVGKPLTYLIWLVGLLWAAEVLDAESESAIFQFIDPLRNVGVVALLTWAVVRFISEGEKAFMRPMDGRTVDETTVIAIGKLMRISVVITAGLVILQTLGFSISGVLAFGGIGGVAVGFAAKDLLANFFGGLMIFLDRSFAVGDWIRSPDRNIEGTVEMIGWRLTRIRTFDKRPLYVPNSTFANISVENPSRMTNRRIKETIGIRYDDGHRMEAIVHDVKKMLREHPEIDTNQTLIVNFNEFGPSSLDFFVYTFTRTTNWVMFHEIKQDIMLRIMQIIDEHGAEIAFPTRTLHMQPAAEPEPLPEPGQGAREETGVAAGAA